MSGDSEGSSAKLTGVWHGIYTYPSLMSVSFVATLIESERSLSGSTHEPCTVGARHGGTLYATLWGSRQDRSVTFVKTYDVAGPHYQNDVAYEGTLSRDGTEIEGRWSIPPRSSGKFLMIRSTGKVAAVARKAMQRA